MVQGRNVVNTDHYNSKCHNGPLNRAISNDLEGHSTVIRLTDGIRFFGATFRSFN